MQANLFYFSFLCVFVCCNPISGKSQGCLKTFFLDISNGGGELFLQDGIRTADNGFVVTGYDANTQGPVLIKVDGTGNIRWTKGYDSLNFSRSLLRTSDGNFLVTATDLFKCFLLKYNPAGELVWAKEMMDPTGSNFRVETIKELADGDLVFLMSSSDLAGGTRNYLARLSSTGNFIWKKELNYEGGIPLANSMYVDSDYIYMAADFLQVEKRPYIDVAQYSLATGALGWRNRLKSTTNQLSNPVLSKVGAELYVATTYGTVFENSGRVDFSPMFACLNAANGQLKNAWVFETPNLHYAPVIFTIDLTDGVYFSNTTDNKLLLAQLMREGADTALHIIKFETDGKVLWAKKYPSLRTQDVKSLQRDGDGFLLTGRTFSGYGNITTGSFLMAVDKDGNVVPGNSGQASDCINLPANVVTQQVSLQEQLSGFLPVSDLPDIDIKNYVPKERNAVFSAFLGCATNTQTCSLLGIRTTAKICAGNFPSTYVGERAPDCRLPVSWSFDTLLFRQVAVTDSSITLFAKMEGLGTLTATVSDVCGSNAVSEAILVYRAAGSLQLGNDTVACFPPAVRVSAGRGYSNYLWNTGSTDSVLLIDGPGLYIVTVTDACGAVALDSINFIPKACIAGFFVPTAFTPNGDGLNDTFKPLLYGSILSYHFAIYNRWGTTVFESSDPGMGWDGTLKQLKQQGNVFIWTCRYQLEGEMVKAEKGTVMLMR